ncbi:unnamed protein product [Leptosia nina]|uniref:Uncharacterized protein n=1 Tax=Leptosia nina TaxID=320188 RepID=A0AAV1JNK2_9NEOP
MSVSCKGHFKEYCKNCTFAGLSHIADESKHWVERWFWVVLVVLSWYGSALLVRSAWSAFVNNPISFGVETVYTDWDTKLPAVAVCEASNDHKIYDVSDAIWTPDHLLDLEDVLKDIVYFRGSAYSFSGVCTQTRTPDPQCPVSNFTHYVNLVRSSCQEMMRNCSFGKRQFDCCEYFVPIETDMGTCFALNSLQVEKPKLYPMVFNVNQKEGVLNFEVLLNSMLYTLGEDEVPTITTIFSSTLKLALGKNYQRQVVVRNIENDPLTAETTPEQRACRFHDENDDGLYPVYSYSSCTVQCRKRQQMQLCGCNDHFMIGTGEGL